MFFLFNPTRHPVVLARGDLLTKDKEATLISYKSNKSRTGYLAPSIID